MTTTMIKIVTHLDLTRFSGHITVTQRGVQHVEERQEIYRRVSVPDCTVGASWAGNSGAMQGIWSIDLVDTELGEASGPRRRDGRSRVDELGARGADAAEA